MSEVSGFIGGDGERGVILAQPYHCMTGKVFGGENEAHPDRESLSKQ